MTSSSTATSNDPEPTDHALTGTLGVDAHGWVLTERGWDADRAVAVGSNFLCGNGYLGYRGTSPEQQAFDFVALVVSDTYDCADGHWRELATAPNPLFVAARAGDDELGVRAAAATGGEVASSLDLRTGTYRSRVSQQVGPAGVEVAVERFASYDELHLLAQRWRLRTTAELTLEVSFGIDTEIWSLNGEHLPAVDVTSEGDLALATGTTVESGIEIAVARHVMVRRNGEPVTTTEGTAFAVSLAAGDELTVETVAGIASSSDTADPSELARSVATSGALAGFDSLAAASADRWAEIWEAADVAIVGDPVAQAALRFSIYHNRICTPAHTDHLPIGARGLSCQAYQGSAFWDQEVYNLPAFLFTEPEIARQLLVYRHRTLDGARRKAQRLGYDGAYYAWVSGLTGDELCPDIFFDDVLTGRPIRNHFNVWQMHISPDIVTTIQRYVDVTADTPFLVDHGAEIAFEVARFLRSFVRYNDWRDTYHCIRLLGPDEWHENVDDNAFTNYQTHAALEFAIETYEWLAAEHSEALSALSGRLGLDPAEIERWRHVRDRLVLPEPDPDTGLIEQFRGFYELEDVGPTEVASRLQHPEEYWGWPNGVAVATKVSKQADVAMLLWLQRYRFSDDVLAANYDYYEPFCSHASSLSHAAFGMVAVHLGREEAAVRHFHKTATVDLLNTNHAVVGGTFIGGIHTAACGGTYQLAVNGFGGLEVVEGIPTIDPKLPPGWSELSYPVNVRGARLRVTITATGVSVAAGADNAAAAEVDLCGHRQLVEPGQHVTVERSDTISM